MNRKKKSTNCLKKYYIKIDKLSKFAIFKLRRRFIYFAYNEYNNLTTFQITTSHTTNFSSLILLFIVQWRIMSYREDTWSRISCWDDERRVGSIERNQLKTLKTFPPKDLIRTSITKICSCQKISNKHMKHSSWNRPISNIIWKRRKF